MEVHNANEPPGHPFRQVPAGCRPTQEREGVRGPEGEATGSQVSLGMCVQEAPACEDTPVHAETWVRRAEEQGGCHECESTQGCRGAAALFLGRHTWGSAWVSSHRTPVCPGCGCTLLWARLLNTWLLGAPFRACVGAFLNSWEAPQTDKEGAGGGRAVMEEWLPTRTRMNVCVCVGVGPSQVSPSQNPRTWDGWLGRPHTEPESSA